MERQAVAKVQSHSARNDRAQRQATGPSAHSISSLQQSVGNQAVQRLFGSDYFQAKLQVSSPGDPFEQEADRVADTVMRMPDSSVSAPVQALSESIQRVPLAVRDDDEEEEKVAKKCDHCDEDTPVQRRSTDEEPEEETQTAPIQRQTEDEEEEKVQTKLSTVQRACDHCEDEHVHRDSDTPQPGVSAPIANNINALKGRGNPLPASTRAFFEPRFGADFSNVRVHTDSHAADTAKSINARAFTVGPNIAFGAGQFAPETQPGKQILAHELTHVVQQGAATSSQQVHRTPEMVQTIPIAGGMPPVTDKQDAYFDHADDVVDIQNKAVFKPNDDLGNYISSLWENEQYEAPVNIKFGSLGSGYIFVEQSSRYVYERCVTDPFGLVGFCEDVPPKSENYKAELQTIPLELKAFDSNKGCVVLLVGITNGFIFGHLAWIEGKKPGEIHPYSFQESPALFNEEAFLPLIYGNQYDGQNYKSLEFINELDNGIITFLSSGELELANQQVIQGNLGIVNSFDIWQGELTGKTKGLEDYKIPIERDPEADLYGESTELVLDKEWTGGDSNTEDGTFTATGKLRASFRNGTLELFGTATYASKRITGEVNIAITTESEAALLFAEHAPAEKKEGAAAAVTLTPTEDQSKEPLALTGWGNLHFKLIDRDSPKPTTGGAPAAGKKVMPEDLEGDGAFVVSSDGYIVMAGKLKLPTNWQFTDKLKYSSSDPEAEENKKLFEKRISVGEAPVWGGTLALDIEIGLDVEAQLNPLELYEIEIDGVYSNHPDYRSEIGITPRFYISGEASAILTASLILAYKLAGLFTVGEAKGTLTGTATANAYIDAAPTVKMIWPDKDSPASYALAGTIHSGGKLTFTLEGDMSVNLSRKKKTKDKEEKEDKEEKYHIGTWTLGSFGLKVNLEEYVLGSGAKPKFDYSKIGFGEKQRQNLSNSIAKDKEGPAKDEKRTGGFTQTEGKKEVEKGKFSETDIPRPDRGAETVDNVLEEDFVMQDQLHELSLTFSGTRDNPTALIEMASGEKKPLDEKIINEQLKVGITKDFVNDDEKKQLEQRERDINAIERESQAVKKNAENAAQKVEPGEEPVVAGFDRLDDQISTYGKKYDVDDLGEILPATKPITPAAPASLRVPKSTGASKDMETLLKDNREKEGYASFDDFRGSNVAVFRYYVLTPDATVVNKLTIVDGPLYEASVNRSNALHSEVIILGMLQDIQKSDKFKKKYGLGYKIWVDQVLSERSPCTQCQASLRQRSALILTSNYHNYYIVHYSGDWIARNRSLMIKYGLTPPPIEDLRAQYGRKKAAAPVALDPH